jgi:hypothetical protein
LLALAFAVVGYVEWSSNAAVAAFIERDGVVGI